MPYPHGDATVSMTTSPDRPTAPVPVQTWPAASGYAAAAMTRTGARRETNPGSVGGACFALELVPDSGALPAWRAGDLVEVLLERTDRFVALVVRELSVLLTHVVLSFASVTYCVRCQADSRGG